MVMSSAYYTVMSSAYYTVLSQFWLCRNKRRRNFNHVFRRGSPTEVHNSAAIPKKLFNMLTLQRIPFFSDARISYSYCGSDKIYMYYATEKNINKFNTNWQISFNSSKNYRQAMIGHVNFCRQAKKLPTASAFSHTPTLPTLARPWLKTSIKPFMIAVHRG